MENSKLIAAIAASKSHLENLQATKVRVSELRKELWEKQKQSTGSEYSEIMNQRSELSEGITDIDIKIMNVKNIIQVLENNGNVIEIEDKKATKYEAVPDFRGIDTEQIIFEEDTILSLDPPPFMPIINEEAFAARGYVFDAIRVSKDSYILAPSKHNEKGLNEYVIVTLDQLVLIADYYLTKAKAVNKVAANEQNKRTEAYYDGLPLERRERVLNQKNYYSVLPAAVKKKVTPEQWESLSFEEKEKLHKPFKRTGPKKIASKLEENQMWTSFHKMYERFINPEALFVNKEGKLDVNGRFANPEVFDYWRKFREMLDFKIKDIRIQREEISETYRAALETSFGDSNASAILLEKFGFLIKRQNGDVINPIETSQIEDAYVSVEEVFGNLKPTFEKYNIKISHTGKKMVFASKAIGMWVPAMGTIAISDKYGDNQFRSTMAHEIAHFMDFASGQHTGKRYASDDYESTAGILAFTFRNNMNKPKSKQTDYINATKECFARAFQQYYGIQAIGEHAGMVHSYVEIDELRPLFSLDNFVPKEVYYSEIKPLIEKFLNENPDLFSGAIAYDFSDDEEINKAITSLEALFETVPNNEKPEIAIAIQSLKLLKN